MAESNDSSFVAAYCAAAATVAHRFDPLHIAEHISKENTIEQKSLLVDLLS